MTLGPHGKQSVMFPLDLNVTLGFTSENTDRGHPESENIDSGCGSVGGSAGFGAAGTGAIRHSINCLCYSFVWFPPVLINLVVNLH